MARWYLAPVVMETVVLDEKGTTREEPRPGSKGQPFLVRSMVCHSYLDGTVLVGLKDDTSVVPGDWLPLTIEDAKSHYKNKIGTEPSDREVF